MHEGRGIFPSPSFSKTGVTQMQYRFTFLFLSLAVVPIVSAQVTSHSPTVFKNAPSAGVTAQKTTDSPVARVNGAVLTSADLLREEYTILPYGRQHNGI